MKFLLALVLFVGMSINKMEAQIDVNLFPFSFALLGNVGISGEVLIHDNFGVELEGFYNIHKGTFYSKIDEIQSHGVVLSGKFYFNTFRKSKMGKPFNILGLYTSYIYNAEFTGSPLAYTDYDRERVALGGLLGNKIIFKKRIVVELSYRFGLNILDKVNDRANNLKE
jgi:outer membrane protein W